jgi:hypothetical protein
MNYRICISRLVYARVLNESDGLKVCYYVYTCTLYCIVCVHTGLTRPWSPCIGINTDVLCTVYWVTMCVDCCKRMALRQCMASVSAIVKTVPWRECPFVPVCWDCVRKLKESKSAGVYLRILPRDSWTLGHIHCFGAKQGKLTKTAQNLPNFGSFPVLTHAPDVNMP